MIAFPEKNLSFKPAKTNPNLYTIKTILCQIKPLASKPYGKQ